MLLSLQEDKVIQQIIKELSVCMYIKNLLILIRCIIIFAKVRFFSKNRELIIQKLFKLVHLSLFIEGKFLFFGKIEYICTRFFNSHKV